MLAMPTGHWKFAEFAGRMNWSRIINPGSNSMVNRDYAEVIQPGSALVSCSNCHCQSASLAKSFGNTFDRHVAIEPRVPRAKDFAHPARADAGSDSVLIE